MRILAIETSCDETAVCVLEADGEFGSGFSYKILGNALFSQAEKHAEFGGVFPNLAKREHEKNLVPIMRAALGEAGLLKNGVSDASGLAAVLEREKELLAQLQDFLGSHAKPDIDYIAVTHGPGLEPALWVGVNFACALAAAWQLPIVAVNHMEGHIVVAALAQPKPIEFPALSLLVSGGHTELVLSREWLQYEMLGSTRDDAAGEAFDKSARLLGLPYPGGPEISRLAAEARKYGGSTSLSLPRPMIDSNDFDFSFSGLKTAVRRAIEGKELSAAEKAAMAREVEEAIVEVLVTKTIRAAEEYGARTIICGGGVSASVYLRAELSRKASPYAIKPLFPPRELSTDNAIMIGLAGYFHALKNEYADPAMMAAQGNLKLA